MFRVGILGRSSTTRSATSSATAAASLYAARIEDLGSGDFVKVDCAACHHVALLTAEALLRQGLSPATKLLDLKGRLRCRGCGRKERAAVSVKWRGQLLAGHP